MLASKENEERRNSTIDNLFSPSEILNSVSSPYFIVDDNLKIAYYNNAFLNSIDSYDCNGIEGLAPGDAIECINSQTNNGCGNSKRCKMCSFRNAINKAFESNSVVCDEVSITRSNNRMNSYNVTVTPINKEDKRFASISIIETSLQSRKNLVDSIFFHDLINLAGSLSGYLEVVKDFEPEEAMVHIPNLKQIADQVLNEIMTRRQIDKAEQNILEVEKDDISIMEIMQDLSNKINSMPISRGKEIEINVPGHDFNLETDQRLIEIVLLNMLINAVESTKMKGNVIFDLEYDDENVVFSVNNKAVLDEETKDNMFIYGFSTKGKGRGSGTYGMKLIGENYLKGNVWFESDEKNGTTFFFKVPMKFPE
ncbi:MAG: HAMP domain-containing sensor histidine kinase [Bacteroidales bacterium]|nr:HAMP domain-containing sensor histidine kinase [Bacteroidales bacterium]